MDVLTDAQMETVERGYERCFKMFIRYADCLETLDEKLSAFENALNSSLYPELAKVIKYDASIGFDPLESVIESMWDEYEQKIRDEHNECSME